MESLLSSVFISEFIQGFRNGQPSEFYFREFVCEFIKRYMNASVNCAPQKDTIDQPQGAESIIVPILFGIIFVVGFIANLVVILGRNFI